MNVCSTADGSCLSVCSQACVTNDHREYQFIGEALSVVCFQ